MNVPGAWFRKESAEIHLIGESEPGRAAQMQPGYRQGRVFFALERTNRDLQRKFRQACCFGSLKGAEVAIYLQVERLHARWAKQPWWEASLSLYFDFLTFNP